MYERKEKEFVRRSNVLKLLIITFKKKSYQWCFAQTTAIRLKVCNLILVILSATISECTCQVLVFSLQLLG